MGLLEGILRLAFFDHGKFFAVAFKILQIQFAEIRRQFSKIFMIACNA